MAQASMQVRLLKSLALSRGSGGERKDENGRVIAPVNSDMYLIRGSGPRPQSHSEMLHVSPVVNNSDLGVKTV